MIFDLYIPGESNIHQLDPRIKLLGLLFFLLSVSLTPFHFIYRLSFYFLLLTLLFWISRINPEIIFNRALVLIPYIMLTLIGLYLNHSIELFLSTTGKICLSVLAVILFTAATSFTQQMEALHWLRAPALIVSLMHLTYRIVFLLVDDVQRMSRACNVRSFGRRNIRTILASGYIISALLRRSMDRADRMANAMDARGFRGDFHFPSAPALQWRQISLLSYFTLLLISIQMVY
jgi:cobalt/nickel transport system permease protein